MKQEPEVEIDLDDYLTAENRWSNFWSVQQEPSPTFHEFLGRMVPQQLKASVNQLAVWTIMVPASAARKVHMLCGPHWYTLLKVYQIKQRQATMAENRRYLKEHFLRSLPK